VRLHVFSDHGMTDIDRTFDLMSIVEQLPLRFGIDYAAVYDSTMARFWFLRDGAEQMITETLGKLDCGAFMDSRKKHEWGVDFPDNRYGDAFFLLNPGTLLIPSHMGQRPLKGMHGYAIDHHASVAAYATSEAMSQEPKRLDDLYQIMKGEIDRCLSNSQSQ